MQDQHDSLIKAFIYDNFVFDETVALDPAESLLDAGLIDSTGVLELVAFLEESFAITIVDAEIIPENLDSLNAIGAYVAGKTAVKEPASAA